MTWSLSETSLGLRSQLRSTLLMHPRIDQEGHGETARDSAVDCNRLPIERKDNVIERIAQTLSTAT